MKTRGIFGNCIIFIYHGLFFYIEICCIDSKLLLT